MKNTSNNQNKEKRNKRIYHSFDEVAKEVFNLSPVSTQIVNDNKRKELQAKFEKNNICKSCGQPMTYVGGNVVVCQNVECKKHPYKLLDEKGKKFAQAIYGEGVTA